MAKLIQQHHVELDLPDRPPFNGPPKGTCVNCKARPATEWWSGEASFMDVNRGAPVYAWCSVCCLEAELAHCQKVAARIPELETKLAALRAGT